MTQDRTGRGLALALAAGLLGSVAATVPSEAQDRGGAVFGGGDRTYGRGPGPDVFFDRGDDRRDREESRRSREAGPDDRRFGTASDDGYGRLERDRIGRDAFERGYRAGRDDERSRGGSRGGDLGRDRFETPAWNDAAQRESMERLDLATARLREALVLLQRQPSGRRRDAALEQTRQALVQAQNAMTWLPREVGAGADEEHGTGRRPG